MIIQLKPQIDPREKASIIEAVENLDNKMKEVTTQRGNYLVGIGKKEFDIRRIGHMPGISDIHIVSDDYKLVSRKWKVHPTQIDLGGNRRGKSYHNGWSLFD